MSSIGHTRIYTSLTDVTISRGRLLMLQELGECERHCTDDTAFDKDLRPRDRESELVVSIQF